MREYNTTDLNMGKLSKPRISYTILEGLLHRLHVPLTGLTSGILPYLPKSRSYVETKSDASSAIQKWQLLRSYQDYDSSTSMIFFRHLGISTEFYLCIVGIS